MANDTQDTEEIIAKIQRSETEELRVTISTYKGHRYIGLRVWAESSEGDMRPQPRKGCSVRLKELQGVHDAIGYIIQRLNAEAQG